MEKEKKPNLFVRRRKLILLTFEAFWIIVFVLDRLSSGQAGGMPAFVYVNF
jgi:hypothetical protein